ncbi:MAG: GNAT family N-acetyltransferase [Chloroflexi bacterium]|nr:GNAT family N-acetyltransferase [Chloroflexota bacterium]
MMHEPGYRFLSGERVLLRPVERADLPSIRKWANDPDIRCLTGEVTPMTEKGADEWFEKISNDPGRVWFVIVVQESGKLIGETGLLRMFPAWRTTDLSIIIGEKEAWRQGYGSEAIHLLLDYAFGYLNFHRVAIGVVGFNQRALRFYEKVGFKREGIQRDGYFFNHRYSDFVMMSILEDEYRSLQIEPRDKEGALANG